MKTKKALRSNPYKHLWLLMGTLCVVIFGLEGCGALVPGPSPTQTACLQGADCSSGVCRLGVCVSQSQSADASGEITTPDAIIATDSQGETSTPPDAEPPTPDSPPLDTPQSEVLTPDNPSVETPLQDGKDCSAGATQACYTGPANTRNVGACKDGQQICQSEGNWSICAGETLPGPEICDDIDNNCDGQVDEGIADLGKECTAGTGECQTKGKNVCATDGINVQCDARPGAPRTEACDGKDNDCDGQTDEDFPDLGKPCSSQGLGACQQQGKLVCAANGASVICDAVDGQPIPETCNGTDDDCDGKIDNIPGSTSPIQRNCYTGLAGTQNIGLCKNGTQQCLSGQWTTTCTGEVTPATKDSCKGQDDDCNGKIDEGCNCSQGAERDCGNDVGQCEKGKQVCANNAWGACKGETTATAEICDGKDNDCDGQIDEDYPTLGNSCSAGLGECKATGTFVCNTNKDGTQCDATPGKAKVEECNGKDDNCNGTIDEANPGGNQNCSTGKQGECAGGKTSCQQGKIVCVANNQPTTESCRNNKDEDCDGQIDEICGPLYPYAVVYSEKNSDGNNITGFVKRADNSNAQFGFNKVVRQNVGQYLLEQQSSTGISCFNRPLFLTPYSHYKRAFAYSCDRSNNSGNYLIHTSDRIITNTVVATRPNRGDAYFFAVVPNQGDDVFAVVQATSCTPPSNDCTSLSSQGSLTIKRTSLGVYRIASSRCNATTSPIFTTIQADQPAGWATAKSLGSGTCEVRTFGPNAVLTNSLNFAVWLPNPSKVAWASITPSSNPQQPAATINASNFFSDQNARWSGAQTTFNNGTCPPNFNSSCVRTRTIFPAWRAPSALLLQYQHNTDMGTSSAMLYNSLQHVYVSSFVGNDSSVTNGTYHVLFVQ